MGGSGGADAPPGINWIPDWISTWIFPSTATLLTAERQQNLTCPQPPRAKIWTSLVLVNIPTDPFATLVPKLPNSRIYTYSGYNIQNTYPYLEASRPT